MTANTVEDPEFGKLVKCDAFIYEGNNKYRHFYQKYIPSERDYTTDDTRKITKSMQQKAQDVKNNSGIER